MLRRRTSNRSRRCHGVPRTDAGISFVEILVAIVLLGTAVIATLTAVRATVIGTRIERDHAKAQQWLQSAVGVLQEFPRVGCDLILPGDAGFADGEDKVRTLYQRELRDNVVTPIGWSTSQLTIVDPVRVWDGQQYWNPDLAPQTCFDNLGYELQLITIQVTSPDGEIIESVEVVKDD